MFLFQQSKQQQEAPRRRTGGAGDGTAAARTYVRAQVLPQLSSWDGRR